jgi:hypothetical protein
MRFVRRRLLPVFKVRPQKQGGVAHGSFGSDPDLDVVVMLINCSVETGE